MRKMRMKAGGNSGSSEKHDSTRSTTNQDSPISVSSSLSSSPPQRPFKFRLPKSLEWIPNNWNWSKIKPVIRCAVVAWCSAVLFIIPRVEIFMGQASFLIVVAAFLSPPSGPFMAVLESEILLLLFVTLAWAWASLGIFLANLARTNVDRTVTLVQAISGAYIEPAPTVILAVFLFLGSAILLYIKARQGPGPYLFPSVFGCISLGISLTTAVLFPFPYYLVGRTIIIPFSFHSALSILGSLIIFPSTISAQFTTRLQLVLTPLISALELHHQILDTTIDSDQFRSLSSSIRTAGDQSEGGLIHLAASARLLSSDFIYARFSPDDFRAFHQLSRRLTGPTNGMALYLQFINPSQDAFPLTPAPSVAVTPTPSVAATPVPSSPIISRSRTPERGEGKMKLHINVSRDSLEQHDHDDHVPEGATTPASQRHLTLPHSGRTPPRSPTRSPTRTHFFQHHQHHQHLHHHSLHHHMLHNSLLQLSRARRREQAVGIFESQRYLYLEATRLYASDPYAEMYTQRMLGLVQECCTGLVTATKEGLTGVRDWLGGVRDSRFNFWVSTRVKEDSRQKKITAIKALRESLAPVLEEFRNDKRLNVLDLYRPAFEKGGDSHDFIMPPHRYLFQSYVYQYHLMQFATTVLSMLDEILRLEMERDRLRLWTPVRRLLTWNKYDVSENAEHNEDDDPDIIQGVQPEVLEDIGTPARRDPDALPPRNAFEWLMSTLYYATASLTQGNVLFAIKAGLLSVILSLPYCIPSSASFAYRNRFVWAIFMGQLTLARFRGDTIFGLVARIMSTFAGGIVGMVMWYISAGSGKGSPYGLAAVFAVCFPFFFFPRLYWPGPPMTNIVFFVTTMLVVGYSYQDVHVVIPGSPGFGFSVAWRRFVLVTIGVTAAFIVSFLPPSTTIRRYQRRLLATTCNELGTIYCAIISFAGSRKESELQEIITSLVAIRSKLKRSVLLRTNAVYEFSLRGRWPVERYQKIMELQLEIGYSLAHLLSVVEHLEPAWTRAFLRRTRFSDSDFQGDTLAVITMIASSLRTGEPLPQITPIPLIDRFMLRNHGLDVIHQESEEDFGLPRSLALETLQDEQYLIFCVGVATAFNIISRLDRLMIAAKDVVGEQYHIHGIGVVASARVSHVEPRSRTTTVPLRPLKDA